MGICADHAPTYLVTGVRAVVHYHNKDKFNMYKSIKVLSTKDTYKFYNGKFFKCGEIQKIIAGEGFFKGIFVEFITGAFVQINWGRV